jgi:hypothetical protein
MFSSLMRFALFFCASSIHANPYQYTSRPPLFRTSQRSLFQSLTPAALIGMQGSCRQGSGASLSLSDCQSCMSTVWSKGDSFTPNIYACASVCQDPSLYSSLTSTISAATDCSTCVQRVASGGAWACESCMKTNPSDPKARRNCFQCVEGAAASGLSDLSNLYYACSACSALTQPLALSNCTTCYQSGISAGRTDFGSCVSTATQLQNVILGLVKPSGMQAQCFDRPGSSSLALSPSGCMSCMTDAPSLKTYGCAAYCQDPSLVTNTHQADQCVSCITATLPVKPWGCQNCMLVSSEDLVRDFCFSCVADDPSNGTVDNYNWGCGQCSLMKDPTSREMCQVSVSP